MAGIKSLRQKDNDSGRCPSNYDSQCAQMSFEVIREELDIRAGIRLQHLSDCGAQFAVQEDRAKRAMQYLPAWPDKAAARRYI